MAPLSSLTEQAVRLPWHCLAVERRSVLEGKKRTPSGHLRDATICFPRHSLAATQFVTFQPPAGASRCLPGTEHHSSAACRSQQRLASGAGGGGTERLAGGRSPRAARLSVAHQGRPVAECRESTARTARATLGQAPSSTAAAGSSAPEARSSTGLVSAVLSAALCRAEASGLPSGVDPSAPAAGGTPLEKQR